MLLHEANLLNLDSSVAEKQVVRYAKGDIW